MKVRIATWTEVRERDKRITSEKRMLTRELQRSRVLVVETGFRSEGLGKPFRNWRGVVERCALGSVDSTPRSSRVLSTKTASVSLTGFAEYK